MQRVVIARLVRFLFTREELERRSRKSPWNLPERRAETAPERLPLPHTFKPQLTLAEALRALASLFLRILLGALLFAVWGACSLAVWSGVHSWFLRFAMLGTMVLAFVPTFAILMLVLRALFRPRGL